MPHIGPIIGKIPLVRYGPPQQRGIVSTFKKKTGITLVNRTTFPWMILRHPITDERLRAFFGPLEELRIKPGHILYESP